MIEASPLSLPRWYAGSGKEELVTKEGGDLMRCSTTQHPWDGGIDRHARSMSVCIVSQDGAILVPRNMPAAPEPFLQAIAPSRDGLVVAVECIVTWYGRAARCAAR